MFKKVVKRAPVENKLEAYILSLEEDIGGFSSGGSDNVRRSCKKRENSKCADEPYENLNAQSTTVCTEDAGAKFENHDVSCHYSEEPFHHKSDVTSLPNSYASHCEIVQDAVFADTTFPSYPMDETEPGILGGPDFTSSILMTDAYPFLPFKHEETAEREEPAEEAQPRTGLEGALAKFTGYSKKFHFEYGGTFLPFKRYDEKFLASCPGESQERTRFYMSDETGLAEIESGTQQRSRERELRIAFNEHSLDPKLTALHVFASTSGICIIAAGGRKQDTLSPIKRMRNIFIR